MLRRAFLSSFGATALVGSPAQAAPQPPSPVDGDRWQPARHPQDDWFDQVPGRHRIFFDTTTAAHVEESVMFAGNYLNANKSAYGLEERDLAVVIGLRHRATPFAFNDAVWSKYGKVFSDRIAFTDPKTGQTPVANPYPGIAGLVKRGVQLAICDMATHALSRLIAEKMEGDRDAIYKELVAGAVGNPHFVAAGIVAVDRAQERGYSIVHIG